MCLGCRARAPARTLCLTGTRGSHEVEIAFPLCQPCATKYRVGLQREWLFLGLLFAFSAVFAGLAAVAVALIPWARNRPRIARLAQLHPHWSELVAEGFTFAPAKSSRRR